MGRDPPPLADAAAVAVAVAVLAQKPKLAA